METLYIGRGRKPQAQANQIFHYFMNMVAMEYYVTMEREKETVEIKEKEKVGRRLPP